MQRIERYGVIALVFLLVTILAVSLWGEGRSKAAGILASVRGGGEEVAALDVQRPKRTDSGPSAVRGPAGRPVPISSPESTSQGIPRKRGRGKNPDVVTAVPSYGPSSASTLRTVQPVPTPATVRVSTPAQQRAARTPPSPRAAPASKKAEFARPPAGRSYEVRSGDTLSVIAQRELGTYKRWPEIRALNGDLDPARLRAGMKLRLPPRDANAAKKLVAQSAQPAKKKPAPQRPKVNGQGSYTVQSGDILGVIAQRELGSARRWPEIVALNPGLDPERLIVGARLRMPAGAVRVHQVARADTTAPPRAPSRAAPRSTGSKGKVR